MNDEVLATQLATQAGSLLRDIQRTAPIGELATPGLKNRGDRESQALLSRMLGEHRPQDAVLSEEATDTVHRLSAGRVWIIDPLDGTREFSEGRDDWAVHVALWEAGDLRIGAVALPGLGSVLSTSDPGQEWTPPQRIRLAVSRTRATSTVKALAQRLDAALVPMGSAGYKASAVIRRQVDAYVHTGGQYEWDSAAPVAVARAAGLFTSRVNGDPLTYNNRNPYLPDLVVCNPHIASDIINHLAQIMEGTDT